MVRGVILCLVVLAVSALAVTAANVVEVPFQAVPDYSRFVQDEFIVVFSPGARSSLVSGPNASGQPTANIASVQAILDTYSVTTFRRQFPGALPASKNSSGQDLTGHYKVKLRDTRDLEPAMAAFEADPSVDHVEKIGIHPLYSTPNDPNYDEPPASWPFDQWHFWDTYGIDAHDAWQSATFSEDVVIGVLDTGVRYFHVDLGNLVPQWGPDDPSDRGNIWVNPGEIPGNHRDDDGNGYIDDTIGWDFVADTTDSLVTCIDSDCSDADNDPDDGAGHGTHVAGIISALTHNSLMVAGVAGGAGDGTPVLEGNGAKVIPLRIGYRADYEGWIFGVVRMDWAAEAMYYVAGLVDRGINVVAINCSWGSSDTGGLDAAVDYLLAHDVMVIHAAGNYGMDAPDFLGTKDGVMNVAASDRIGNGAGFTNHGAWVDVAAPGHVIMSTYRDPLDPDPTHHYAGVMSGTSMAAPHVCGIAALLEACNAALTGPDKFDLIINNTIPHNDTRLIGSGIANARLALDAAGCSETVCRVVAEFDAEAVTGYAPLTVSFNDRSSGSGITRWMWSFGDGGVSLDPNPSHTYRYPGAFEVSLAIAGDGPCFDTRKRARFVTVVPDEHPATKVYVGDLTLNRALAEQNRVQGVAVVTIIDNRNHPVQDAVVTGEFSGAASDANLTVTTNAAGQAVFNSTPWKKNEDGEVCFNVANVFHSTLPYQSVSDMSDGKCVTTGGSVTGIRPPDAHGEAVTWVYPNPFKPAANILFDLESAGDVEIIVYDVSGRAVRYLAKGYYGPGEHRVLFDGVDDAGRPLASGVYYYRFSNSKHVESGRLILLK